MLLQLMCFYYSVEQHGPLQSGPHDALSDLTQPTNDNTNNIKIGITIFFIGSPSARNLT